MQRFVVRLRQMVSLAHTFQRSTCYQHRIDPDWDILVLFTEYHAVLDC